jgi:hypothetical protein
MGNLDMKQIVELKVAGTATDILYSRLELLNIEIPYRELHTVFEHRFKDKLPENYHYTQLQTATQKQGESPEMFVDLCKSLSLKTVKYSDNPEENRIFTEEAQCRLPAAYCAEG